MTILIEHCGLIPYRQAYQRQMELVRRLREDDSEADRCLLLEHPAVFTLGRNGSSRHIGVSETFLAERGIEVIKVERGGEVTYHGPGQIVCYPIVRLRRSGLSVVDFVRRLEQVMLETVRAFALEAGRDPRNHGIWIGDAKLGSVGIAIRHGITFHGLALNVSLDLEPFGWINPCGLANVSMSSMAREQGTAPEMTEVRAAMIAAIGRVFDRPLSRVEPPPEPPPGPGPVRTAKPDWLRQRLPSGPGYEQTRRLVRRSGLHTVCREARCPNQFECYGKGTATFLIMGERCTRNCRFCAVVHGRPIPPDDAEPARIAAAVAEMGLDYVVLTSVTRDDLADGGADHFVRTLEAIRAVRPAALVEVLIPDLQGDAAALEHLCRYRPAVVNHNMETVRRLYPEVRPQAVYERSLELLRRVREFNPDIITKSGLMVGLGERREELEQTMADIRTAGADLLTLGQYLQPTAKHLPVRRFVPPEEFVLLRDAALALGFSGVAAGPHVRSSYRAGQLYRLATNPAVSEPCGHEVMAAAPAGGRGMNDRQGGR